MSRGCGTTVQSSGHAASVQWSGWQQRPLHLAGFGVHFAGFGLPMQVLSSWETILKPWSLVYPNTRHEHWARHEH